MTHQELEGNPRWVAQCMSPAQQTTLQMLRDAQRKGICITRLLGANGEGTERRLVELRLIERVEGEPEWSCLKVTELGRRVVLEIETNPGALRDEIVKLQNENTKLRKTVERLRRVTGDALLMLEEGKVGYTFAHPEVPEEVIAMRGAAVDALLETLRKELDPEAP